MCGRYRTGKSYLLNKLLEAQGDGVRSLFYIKSLKLMLQRIHVPKVYGCTLNLFKLRIFRYSS